MGKNLVDNDELEIKGFQLSGDVRGIYVKPKGNNHLHHEEHNIDTDSE